MRALLLGLLVLAALPSAAQDEPVELPPPERNSIDRKLFYAIYENESPVFEATMRAVNGASIPVFLTAAPVHGLAMLATGESAAPTGRLALSQLGVVGEVFLIKNLIGRARPHTALSDVVSRQRKPPGGLDPYSFPSGHSATAFAIATSLSLSYPEWYVIIPAYAWSTSTALARVWFGMHYPSDIAVGAVLGAGTATLVHLIFADGEDETVEAFDVPTAPAFTIRIPLGP